MPIITRIPLTSNSGFHKRLRLLREYETQIESRGSSSANQNFISGLSAYHVGNSVPNAPLIHAHNNLQLAEGRTENVYNEDSFSGRERYRKVHEQNNALVISGVKAQDSTI